MTVAPAAARRGERSREEVAPEEARAMSIPEKSAVSASSTSIARPFHSIVVPAEREEAKKRISSTGKSRSMRIARMTVPTCPVAPTMATRMGKV